MPPRLPIHPPGWREVFLMLDAGEGDVVETVLLRPLSRLAAHRAEMGAAVWLDLPHVGVRGWAEVTAVGPCPPIEEGAGRVVMGRFRHRRAVVCDLRVEGEPEPIGVTPTHPFWSADRNGWVPAGELREGERLLAADGSTPVVESFTPRPEPEPVYNIEVEGDHCYRVGEQGLLVHNASAFECGCVLFNEEFKGKKYWPLKKIVSGPLAGQERATLAWARYTSVQDLMGGSDAETKIILAGWIRGLNTGRQIRIARGHLIGKQLGGSGENVKNLVPICQQTVNLDMANQIENQLRAWVEAGDHIDYEVEPDYNGPSSAVPKGIKIKYTRWNPRTHMCSRPNRAGGFLYFPATENLKQCRPRTPTGYDREPL